MKLKNVNWFAVLRDPHHRNPILVVILILMIFGVSRSTQSTVVDSTTSLVEMPDKMNHLALSSSQEIISNEKGKINAQQQGTSSEYVDPVTKQLLSEIMVKSGTVRYAEGASIVLPEFNHSISLSFNFLIGRNLSLRASKILPTSGEDVAPVLVQNDESALSGYFLELTSGQWVLTITTTSTENVSFLVLLKIQHEAWSSASAVELKNDVKYTEAFIVPGERHFWKVTLEKNQRGSLLVTTSSLSLLGARLQVYAESNLYQPLFDISEKDSIQSNAFNVSWVAEAKQAYFVLLIAGSNLDSEINPYQIVFRVQEKGYSFSTAIRLEPNSPQILLLEASQTIVQQHYLYFEVSSSQPTKSIEIIISEITEDLLEDATVYVFDSRDVEKPILTLVETNSPDDGVIRSRMDVNTNVKYYLVVEPTTSLTGSYRVEIRTEQASTFLVEVMMFLLSVIIVSVIVLRGASTHLLRLDPFSYTIPIRKDEFITLVKKNSFLSYFLTDYNESEARARALIPFKRFSLFRINIWYLKPATSDEERTRIEFHPTWSRYVHLVELSFFIGILIINQTLFYYLLGWHWTFFFFAPMISPLVVILSLFMVLLVTFGLIAIPRLVFHGWHRKVTEVMALISALSHAEMTGVGKHPSLPDALKQVAFIRVLWSQAKKAYKSGQKSLFIVKADSCVKQLVHLRARQLGMTDVKNVDFIEVIEYLRENGFDVPSKKKIMKNHELRNRIIHSTYLPSDEELQKSWEYYQTIITRLGLRT